MAATHTNIDLSSFAFSQNPYAVYDQLRTHGNIHYLPGNNLWLVIGYNEIVEVLTNYESFTSEGNNAFDPFLLNCDPPDHTIHRKIVSGDQGLFAHARVNALTEANAAICKQLVDALKQKSTFDVLSDFAMPFSSLVILNLLGIKPDISKEIKQWSDGAVLNSSIYNTQLANEQWERISPVIAEWISEVEKGGSRSGLAELVFHEEAGNYFNKETLLHLVKVLLLGGNETTPNLVSSALLILLKDKQLMNAVKQDPSLLQSVIFETLRLEAPTQIIQRVTTHDVKIGDELIPKGALVALSIGAANRDPSVFENPDVFDVNRSKNKILSFGYGPHYCIGANLAKQEATLALQELITSFPGLALDDEAKPEYKHSSHVRGLKTLPLYTNSEVLEKIAQAKQKAVALLRNSLEKYGEFPSLENYPRLNENEWHYTYPSPFVHANVLFALSNTSLKNDPSITDPALRFILEKKEEGDTWRFWKIDQCHNPVPPDVDDLAVCSFVLNKYGHHTNNKKLLYHNIRQHKLLTWIKPSVSLFFIDPALAVSLYRKRKPVAKTIAGNMLDYRDSELGVMVNALLYLGQDKNTEPIIDHCISLWNNKTDAQNFYDNDLVLAYHLARAYRHGIEKFVVLSGSIAGFISERLDTFNFAELNIAFLALRYLGVTGILPQLKSLIIHEVTKPGFAFAHFRYFTSKDRNFYGGSSCLTAAWFLEVMEGE